MKLSKIFLSLGLIFAGLMCFQTVSAQVKNNPNTVTDYYLLLPTDNLPILESVRSRRSIIKIEDTKNGFLRLEGAWEGWAEIALFRKTNREAVIAVEQVGCGPACDGALQFLIYKNGKWTDATANVLPQLEDEDILAAYNRLKPAKGDEHSLEDMPATYWVLPQKGTTIKLVVGDASESEGKTLMSFNWNGNKFVRAAK